MDYPINESLLKRMTWIAACGLLRAPHILGEVNWKSNTTKYFFRCYAFWRLVEKDGRVSYETYESEVGKCYFLGVYPNYWNIPKKSIFFAHWLGGIGSFPMGSEPGLEGEYIPIQTREDIKGLANSFNKKDLEWYFYSGIIPGEATDEERERLDKFRRDYESERSKMAWSYEYRKVDNYIMQMWALAAKRKIRSGCFKKYYPYEPKIPQAKVKGGLPGQTWPGIPMNEITPPIPTRPSAGHRAPPEINLRLTLTFGIKEGVPYNALDLTLLTEEL